MLDVGEKGSDIIMQINYQQNSLRILDLHYDTVALCVIIAQAYCKDKSFKNQVAELTGLEVSSFETYPVSIQTQQIKWHNIFNHIT